MNAAHFHLIINHFSIIMFLCALVIAVYGLVSKKDDVKKIALSMIVAGAVFALPTYFSGEPAAEFLENSAIVNDMLIEEHEEAAEKSILITVAAGALAGATLWLMKQKAKLAHPALIVTTVVSTGAIAMLGWTGSKGGLIRHPEMLESEFDAQRQSPGVFAPGSDLDESGEQSIDLDFDREDTDDAE